MTTVDDQEVDLSKSDSFIHHKDRAVLLVLLKALSIAAVKVEYSGSGDSGQIDLVRCFDQDGNEIATPEVTLDLSRTVQLGFDLNVKDDTQVPLEAALEALCYRALDIGQWDWYNNDGGQGHLEIDLKTEPPTINLLCQVNFMQHEDHGLEL